MSFYSTTPSVLQELLSEHFSAKNVRLFVKRDDLIDAEVSGNKWRKLKYSIALAQHQKKEGILTFGGAFSNHLLAVAAACQRSGLKSIGVVRGDELTSNSNKNLERCTALGMELVFISRIDYSLVNDKMGQEEWKEDFPTYLLVPEGGANFHGMVGCQEIWKELPHSIDHLFVAQGTAATSCGLLAGLPESVTLHVVPAIKGFESKETMQQLLFPFLLDEDYIADLLEQVVVHSEHHFGGYAKTSSELLDFIAFCQKQFNLPLDFVYTGKAFKALWDMISNTDALDNSTVVFLHTGGLFNGSVTN